MSRAFVVKADFMTDCDRSVSGAFRGTWLAMPGCQPWRLAHVKRIKGKVVPLWPL
jgi:hypothetical protein